MSNQSTMDFAAGEDVLRHTSYCRTCHARVQECAGHTADCRDCFGTYDHVVPLEFDPVSVKAGNTSEQCPWSAHGKANHGGVYVVVTWAKN